MLNLRFEKDEDGSGCGTLIISKNKYDFLFVPITHTTQLDMMNEIVGDYHKIKT